MTLAVGYIGSTWIHNLKAQGPNPTGPTPSGFCNGNLLSSRACKAGFVESRHKLWAVVEVFWAPGRSGTSVFGIQSIGIAAAHLFVSWTLHAETSGLGTIEHHWVDLLGTGYRCHQMLQKRVQRCPKCREVGLTINTRFSCVARFGDLTHILMFSGLNQSI